MPEQVEKEKWEAEHFFSAHFNKNLNRLVRGTETREPCLEHFQVENKKSRDLKADNAPAEEERTERVLQSQ